MLSLRPRLIPTTSMATDTQPMAKRNPTVTFLFHEKSNFFSPSQCHSYSKRSLKPHRSLTEETHRSHPFGDLSHCLLDSQCFYLKKVTLKIIVCVTSKIPKKSVSPWVAGYVVQY